MRGHCYAVAGGKGGVGKTTTAVNVAYGLAARDYSVVVVDADLAMSNLASVLGVSHEPTLHDVLADEASLRDAIDTSEDVAVLVGDPTLEHYLDIDPAGLGTVIKRLRTAFDIVLVDTGAGVHHETMVPCGTADGVVLVTTPDETAVADTERTAEMVETVDGTVVGLVVTQADESEAATIAARLGVDLLGVVPYAPERAGNEPVIETVPNSALAMAYDKISSALAVVVESSSAGAQSSADVDR